MFAACGNISYKLKDKNKVIGDIYKSQSVKGSIFSKVKFSYRITLVGNPQEFYLYYYHLLQI